MNDPYADSQSKGGGNSPFGIRRFWPVALLLAGLGAYYAFGLDAYFSFDLLRENREILLDLVERYSIAAALLYSVVYIVVVAFSLPGGAFLTITGGFLFGPFLGTGYVVISATIGATLLFLIARTALGDALRRRMGPSLRKMEAGFRENAFSYLLVLRLIPLFPFFVVNLVPAFLGVSLRTYIPATLIGIIPGTVVFAQVGAGLGSIFDSGKPFTVSGILTPDIVLALSGLALLSLAPILYKKLKAKRRGS
ncbi:MAG: TVP38/TMEM64 family protein [Alphaproteobacteria bacterium]